MGILITEIFAYCMFSKKNQGRSCIMLISAILVRDIKGGYVHFNMYIFHF